MKLSIGSVLNMTPADGPWEIAFDLGAETDTVVAPVIGWATVVGAHMNDGTVYTELKPAFVWGDMVWTEIDLREHTPGLGHVEIRAREIPRALSLVGERTRSACPLHDAAPGQNIPGDSCTCDD